MNAADQAHLAAMGLAIPLPLPLPHPVSRRQEIRDRAETLRVCTLWPSVTRAEYKRRHDRMRKAGIRRFWEARCQHKLMQTWQNDESLRYRERVSALVNGQNPAWAFGPDLQWLPGFLASGDIPLEERKIVAGIAEETAHYAIEQAERHNRLLRKWLWGYDDRFERKRHERFAQSAKRAAIK
ncbi:uncharacterized protein FSUBG_4358 [Fusarium subglutinans]|uniref:Uncharacterized protein n=1 Tax=Gibberella subglutinans TaxID=42677 RepID=A0A8H5Q664_GIBSU|nr:uncharacterized protein FSUBG_4358 [Fusarium subglutinans]KAF5608969.1 hypothetical protein FSUBG_4358 [Fusarium subglutinans]